MIKNLRSVITAAVEGLERLDPTTDLAREVRESVIVPMTGDEFRTYIRERATGRAAYQMWQDGQI